MAPPVCRRAPPLRPRALLAGLFLLACHAAPAAAEDQGRPIFAWIDGDGALHATNALGEVPEPFYAIYRARLDAVAQAQRAAAHSGQEVASPPSQAAVTPQQVAPVPDAGVRGALAQAEARARWRATAMQARNALVDATVALRAAEEARAEAARNPLLNFTPAVRAAVQAADARVVAARQQALLARRRVVVELPEQARRAGVPPAWLLP